MPELTGGRVNYYLVQVDHPQREDQEPYQAECEDIIQALGMTFDEGCAFKALWRSAAARQGNGKPGSSDRYDAEKIVHYAERILRRARRYHDEQDHGPSPELLALLKGTPVAAAPSGERGAIPLTPGEVRFTGPELN